MYTNTNVQYPNDLDFHPKHTHTNLSLSIRTHTNLSLSIRTHTNLSLSTHTHTNLSLSTHTHTNLSLSIRTHCQYAHTHKPVFFTQKHEDTQTHTWSQLILLQFIWRERHRFERVNSRQTRRVAVDGASSVLFSCAPYGHVTGGDS